MKNESNKTILLVKPYKKLRKKEVKYYLNKIRYSDNRIQTAKNIIDDIISICDKKTLSILIYFSLTGYYSEVFCIFDNIPYLKKHIDILHNINKNFNILYDDFSNNQPPF